MERLEPLGVYMNDLHVQCIVQLLQAPRLWHIDIRLRHIHRTMLLQIPVYPARFPKLPPADTATTAWRGVILLFFCHKTRYILPVYIIFHSEMLLKKTLPRFVWHTLTNLWNRFSSSSLNTVHGLHDIASICKTCTMNCTVNCSKNVDLVQLIVSPMAFLSDTMTLAS